MPGQRVCLFGGTFDPVHTAHLRMAEKAIWQFHLDRIIFIPAGNPPHKDAGAVSPYADRLEMLKLACAGHERFEVSDIENSSERSFTVNTLERFRQQLSEDDQLFFLIGADAFDELETWHRWKDVVQLTEFIVVSRPGKSYHAPPGAKVLRLDDVQLPTASTAIRAKLATGEPTPEVPAPVREFIQRRGLYR
ncbi:MAG TPA: nicotinate-nucleotide adenylyltransferase [Bryobacteraceae bacterium]|nr:nicotinate-nucleotide adenylyltransferase [Bryobacteraceae bacterium]